MQLEQSFTSGLFLRVFFTTIGAIVLLYLVMYLLSVPFIQNTVERIEERTAQTVLSDVCDAVKQIHDGLEQSRLTIMLERKMALRDIIAVVESRASWLQQQVRQHSLTEAQAKELLLNDIRYIHYGNNDYVWASDYHSVLVAHPDPLLNRQDFSEKRDARGNLIVPPMVEKAQAAGEGFHSYWWRRLGQEHQIEKITFFKHLPFFELVIGTGVYIDDIESTLNHHRTQAIDELRTQLHKIRLARTGYVYIFDRQGLMIVHPNSSIEGKTLEGLVEPATGQDMLSMLIHAADQPEGVRYRWDHPAEPGHYVRNKISWVRYLPEFNWYIGSSVYVDEFGESARILRNRMLAVFTITLLAAIVLVYLFVKRLVEPLTQLSATARLIEHGDLEVRCHLRRDDEIGVVVAAFNGMMDRLRDNILHLDTRVHERTAELEAANARLQQLDTLKSDFLSAVSHELRTPLTSIRGFISLIEREFIRSFAEWADTDPVLRKKSRRIQDNLHIISLETERLTRLINDVLDLAKIESGRVEWRDETIHVTDCIHKAAATVSGLFAQKPEVRLQLDIAEALPAFIGDPDRMQQVLMNLLNNAVKFTDQGTVTVRAFLNAQQCLQIDIRDTGIGFAPEEAGTIFDRFQQARQGDTLMDRPKGTGLGLAISRDIVTRHGGRLWAQSMPGQGSLFSLTLPPAP